MSGFNKNLLTKPEMFKPKTGLAYLHFPKPPPKDPPKLTRPPQVPLSEENRRRAQEALNTISKHG